MEKSNRNLFMLAVLLTAFVLPLAAQTNVNLATGGTTPGSPFTINPPGTCYFNFFDNGGPAGNYSNNVDASVTFLPANAATHRIQATFTTFGLEIGWDAFYVFNSSTVGVNQVPGPEGVTFSGFPGGNWQTVSPGTITANTGLAAVGANAAEALTFQFRSDPSTNRPGWSAIVRQVPKMVCTMTAAGPLSASTGPGNAGCSANVTTALPTFQPGGCNAGLELRYRINGGAPTAAPGPGPVVINAPKGANVISWELVDPCGGGVVSSATQMITVIDNTPPTVACPSNVTLNLLAGQCAALYSFDVPCTDNCAFTLSGTVTQPFDFNNGQAGIMFDLKNLGSTPMTITQFGPSLDAGTWPMEVYVTSAAATWQGHDQDVSAWTLAGAQSVTSVSPGVGTPVPGFGITLAPGQSRGIYITSTTGAPVNYTGVTNADGFRTADDGTLEVSSNPGAGKIYPFGTTYQSRAYNGYVQYSAGAVSAPVQTAGLPSGAEFPAGVTTNVFTCTDAAGNVATCSFKVTVSKFQNPSNSLVCNDLVNIALGEDCTTAVGADQVLEGGPYRCYDEYIVQLDKIAPLGNGPWVPAILTAADIGKTYGVRVTDPVTGNKCTGNLKVFDNIPPQMNDCPVTLLPCNYPTAPTYANTASATLKFSAPALPANVVDFQTREVAIPVDAPAGSTVNDVDFHTRISGDPFNSNLRIQVESPSGTVVTVWNQLTGCMPAPLWVNFDDEATGAFVCANYTTNLRAPIPFGLGTLSSFDNEPVNGTWIIRVMDLNGNNDISIIERAELRLRFTGTFGAGFPNGLTAPPATQIANNSYFVPAGFLDACSDVTLSYTDQTTPQNCASPYTGIINRRWLAKDAGGNTATCIQQINLLRATLTDVVFPPHYDDISNPSFDCSDQYPTPAYINGLGLQGSPFVFSEPGACGISIDYEDHVIWVCDGSYTIRRTWSVSEACSGQVLQYDEIIGVQDKQGPAMACPADMIVTTDPFSCCATVNLPDVIIGDPCSATNNISATIITIEPFTGDTIGFYVQAGSLSNFPGNNSTDPDTLGVIGSTECLPIGEHTVIYTAVDDCGNASTCSFHLSVRDFSPPVASCDETTVVGIGIDDPKDCYLPNANSCAFAGVTLVSASVFNDGSYDNCANIKFAVRRVAPYSDCILGLNTVNGHPDCNDAFSDLHSEFDRATEEGDSIKFYCCEVGTTQMIVLRVYQLDPDGSISAYPDGSPIYNECQVMVEVQDKIKPQCEPPLNVTVNCENFDPSLWAYGKPLVYDNCCLDTSKHYQGQKGLTGTVNYSLFDTVCNKGTIIRTFRAYDCHGLSSQCTQRVVVKYNQDYAVRFPDDAIVTVCDGSGLFGEPIIYGKDCELTGISFSDEVYTVVPDACYKIERTWTIINWCTYDPNGICINVPNPSPNANSNHPSNLPGPIVSQPGTPAPWAPTVVKIKSTDLAATNYGDLWTKEANCYKYKQIIKVVDGQKPAIVCPASPVTFCDFSPNNPQLWNETYWYDQALGTHDLCEGPADLSVSATDACSGSAVNIHYLLFLDLDGDGVMETVVNSLTPPAPGAVQYNNAGTPNFTGGTPRTFDERSVAISQKYRFGIQTTTTGNNVTAAVRWNTLAAPGNFAVPELPYGQHKIKWIVQDGCGNESVCEYSFVVKDCKGPTVLCINGLSANMMPTGLTVFTSDFLQHATDNCTPMDLLRFGIRKSGTGTGFPLNTNGQPQISVLFTCNELGTQPVEIWAIDAAGNADYCETYIIIQDNLDQCPNLNGTATVAGLLKTEAEQGLEEGHIELTGQNPAGPSFNHLDMTDNAGAYKFSNAVPMFSNYTLTPMKDDNPLNGVSTYDLVLISKHILGLQAITSPYKMIAADANRSGSITTYDIVELRKLILGIYTELPNSTAWRFVDKSFAFPNQNNPFQSVFPENKTVAEVHGSAMADNFVAIKVGDVNGNALANSYMSTEDRSAGTLLFDLDDRRVEAGEEFTVQLQAAERVAGYQFTLNYTDLQVLNVLPGEHMSAENFAVLPADNALTTSWSGNTRAGFGIRFRATKGGQLSQLLGVSSRVTKAEAYSLPTAAGADGGSLLEVAFRFHSAQGSAITGVGFEVYQNQPNPFVNKTAIGFHLPARQDSAGEPEATEATLTVYDETGRLVYAQTGQFSQGYNTFQLERALLNASGLLIYKLETPEHSATRKMLQIK